MLVAAASAGGGGVFVGAAVGMLGALVFGIGGAASNVHLLKFVAVGMATAVSEREGQGRRVNLSGALSCTHPESCMRVGPCRCCPRPTPAPRSSWWRPTAR